MGSIQHILCTSIATAMTRKRASCSQHIVRINFAKGNRRRLRNETELRSLAMNEPAAEIESDELDESI